MTHLKTKHPRVVEVGGDALIVPPYIYRTKAGWMVRVMAGQKSTHLSDSNYGGPRGSLSVAEEVLADALVSFGGGQ